MLRRAHAPFIAAAIIFMLIISAARAQAYTVSYTYKLDPEGRASVTVMISGVEGTYAVYVKVDKGIVPGSAIATNEVGNVLPVELVNGTTLAIYTANMSKDVVLSYTALVATQVTDYIEVVISPAGPATVVLPKGAALLYFNGSATISMYDDTITLSYGSEGTYMIQFIPPIATTTSAATSPATTTTPAASTTTPATTMTTTSPTATTTSPPPTTTTSSATTPIPTESTSTTSQSPITTTSPISTATSFTTKPSKITSATAPPPSGEQNWGAYVAIVVALVVIIAVVLVAMARRRKGGAASAGIGGLPSEGPSGLIVEGNIDERDVEILRALKDEKLTISGLARKVGLSKSVIWRRVRKLADLGLINKVDEGGKTYLSLTRSGEEFLSKRDGS
ncbi:MAG: winged helix-turn-helix transcriptional regulator [Desulfurococcales archaeon]|nr:winged helix-turn-helix transcriptional regulator [Desulfurococcales archaeon]